MLFRSKLLKKVGLKEQRYVNHLNNVISSYVIQKAKTLKKPVVVMEDLKHILERTKVRKKQRYNHITWAFKKLQDMIQYKAVWEGIPVVFIKPNYTSQICPKCFSTNKRIKHTYSCSHCSYQANSDFVGSVNIAKKFFEFIQFEEQASINYALNTTCSKSKALKIGSVQKPIKQEDVPLIRI